MSSSQSTVQAGATANNSTDERSKPSWGKRFTDAISHLQNLKPLPASQSFVRDTPFEVETYAPSNVAIRPYQIKVAKKQLPGVLEKPSQQEDGNRIIECDWLSLVEEGKSSQDNMDNSNIQEGNSNQDIAPINPNQKKIILYLHGGGYIIMSAKSHRSVTGNIVKNSGYPVISLNYRLAPEDPFPAGLLDAVYSYLYLIDAENGLGYKPENVFIAGDSAGAGLSIATCCYLRDHQYEKPASIIALSPWVTPVEKEKRANKYDFLNLDDYQTNPIRHYLGNYTVDNPYITLTNASLVNLPPLLVQYGEVESFRYQIEDFISKYQDANNVIRPEMYDDMPHVFHLFDFHSTSQKAFKSIGQFFRDLDSDTLM